MKKYLFLVSIFLILITCDQKLIEPIADNPLDPENSETSGDPFSLTIETIMEGVQLSWQPLTSLVPDKYLIFKKKDDDPEFSLTGEVNHPISSFIDILNGETLTVNQIYWYYVTAERDNQITDSSFITKYDVSLYLDTDLLLTKESQGIKLEWSLDSEHHPDSYNIYRRNISTAEFQQISTVSYPDSVFSDDIDGAELMVNNTYVYYVTSNINSIEVDSSMEDTVSLDFELNNIILSPHREDGILGVKIDWEQNSLHTPDNYKVYRSDSEMGDYVLKYEDVALSYFDSLDESEMGSTFYYYILADFKSGLTSVELAVTQSVTILFTIPGSYDNIQAGIDNSIDGDSINVATGTYMESIDFTGKKIKLKCQGQSRECILDGNNSETIITFSSNEDNTTILDGFTIQNGSSNDEFDGGGMTIRSDPLIQNCTFISNTAYRGGAVFLREAAEPSFIGCNFENNTSTKNGGAIYCYRDATPTFNNCEFTENQSLEGNGGALCLNEATPTITNCVFSNNQVNGSILIDDDGFGGAIYIYDIFTGLTFDNCSFDNNTAETGGAVYIDDARNIEFRRCQFFENLGTYGGGLYLNDSGTNNNRITLQNCIFWNQSALDGGAIKSHNSKISINYCTVYGNKALAQEPIGGGLYSGSYEGNADISVINSIFYENIGGSYPQLYVYPGTPISLTYSNIDGGIDFIDGGGFEDIGNIKNNPLFISPDGDNFNLLNFHLQTIEDGYDIDSPCKGSGENGTDMGAYGGIYGDWGE